MTRLLIWSGVALLLHAGLLFIPVYDTPAVGSSGQGVSVRIQSSANQNQTDHNAHSSLVNSSSVNSSSPQSPAVKDRVSAEKLANVTPTPEKPSAEIAKISKPKPVQTQPVQELNRAKITVAENITPIVKKSAKPKPVAAVDANTVNTAEKLEADSSSVNEVAAHKETHLTGGAVSTKQKLISARPASSKKPKYPRRAIVRNQQGSVRVELLIKEDGFVEEATLLESSGFPLLDKSVLKYVNEERFIAALDKGLPVASTQLFTYRFVLH
ncbi:TonB family protein [Neptuniibacter sp.]|uniref:energy transducer TonB n=1 Tax=Neptuniibacter sp. TaxID=1962643 RepID=UPI003B5C8757